MVSHVSFNRTFHLSYLVCGQIKVSTLWHVLSQLSVMSKADSQGLKPLCRTRAAFFDTVLKRCLELHQSSEDLWWVAVGQSDSLEMGFGRWLVDKAIV